MVGSGVGEAERGVLVFPVRNIEFQSFNIQQFFEAAKLVLHKLYHFEVRCAPGWGSMLD